MHGALAPAAAAQQAEPDSAAQIQAQDNTLAALAGRRSWLSDRRDFRPGDLITVLVDEYTLATANKSTIAARDRSSQASLGGVDVAGGNCTTSVRGAAWARSRAIAARRRGRTGSPRRSPSAASRSGRAG